MSDHAAMDKSNGQVIILMQNSTSTKPDFSHGASVAAGPGGASRFGTPEQYNILYVDDEEQNLTSFRAAFRRNFTIHTALSAREGLKIIREVPIHLIVTDQRMPEMTGVQFLEAVIPECPDAVRMILTGFSDIDAIIKAINSGRVYRYVTKPWNEAELKMTLEAALEFYSLQARNRRLVSELQQKVLDQERLVKLFQRYIPERVLEELMARTDDMPLQEAETRIISVMFADIRDFTEIAEQLEPSKVVDLLNDFFSFLTNCVKRHNGTVNKFIGDGMLALFGAPISYIGNGENAVLSALSIREGLVAFNDRNRAIIGRDLEIGISVNSGEVIVGNIGSEDRMDYTAIGDTVNLASRIESLTKGHPNAILISESTYRSASHAIEAREWEPISIRGKAEPVKIYEVTGAK
ncbi:MAG TPA: adenylate/guanylate cyclase domain-containing protein [Candidatus Kapabacteria bacterium]|nr:adenylate/guanylate cyclase domain-containing protein [Candidatus Kapabacteria bacterium]